MPAYQKIIWIGLSVAVIAILILGYFLFLAPAPVEKIARETEKPLPVAAQPAAAAPAAADEIGPVSPLDLDLNQSDTVVRELIAAESVPGLLLEWSRQKDLLRLLVAAVDNIAQGQSPSAHLAFLAPREGFRVIEKNGTIYLDPRSFRRYDPLVNVFMAIPDKTMIIWYKKLLPTLEQAFKELGYPEITFSQRLQQAIEQLTQVPLTREDLPLEKKVLSYAFADYTLEELNPAQKHFLRLGAHNVVRIQKKLRNLAAAI